MAERPTGVVTFLFTDVEGSTRLWERWPLEMRRALEVHDCLVRDAIASYGGFVFSTGGDGFAAAFSSARDAVDAARTAQTGLAEFDSGLVVIRARMGAHSGETQERDGDYFGPTVNRAARIMAVGHGGQVLVSSATAALIGPDGLVDLGEHRLKDLSAGERIFQAGPGEFPRLRSLDRARHNLPVERTPLVGRKEDVDHVGRLVAEHRLVTLLGMGGTGKTRLACAVAADLADEFADGVWFVDLVPATGPEVAELIATAVGVSLSRSHTTGALAQVIADRHLLVVVDNCEHVADDVAEVLDELLGHTTGPRFLATSRESLQLPGERQIRITPLAVGADLASPAVELFAAAAERVDVRVQGEDVAAIARICEQLDGLPLAIELAAAQLRHLSLEELGSRLDQRFELLTLGRGRTRRRQASLQAVLKDTWAMLDAGERELLMALAAFPGGFDAADVDAVRSRLGSSVPSRTFASLADRSLVARDGLGRRRLLETVKLFAQQRWEDLDDPARYVRHHTDAVMSFLCARPAADGYTSYEIRRWFATHYEDARAVEDRLVAAGDVEGLAAWATALTVTFTMTTGTRAAALIGRVERYLTTLTLDTRQRGALSLLAASAALQARRQDWLDRGAVEAEQAFRSTGHPVDLAAALIVRSWMAFFSDRTVAHRMLQEAAELADGAGSAALASAAIAYSGYFHAVAGDLKAANEVRRAVETRVDRDRFDYDLNLLLELSVCLDVVADPSGALRTHQQLARHLDALGGSENWKDGLMAVIARAAVGDRNATRALHESCRGTARSMQDDDGLPDLLVPLAVLAWSVGDHERARSILAAIRHAPRPTQAFPITVVYRQLRNSVGVADHNPLAGTTIAAFHEATTAWLETV